jgi:hypothetical protein
MTLYQRQVARMYMLPVLAALGVFCTTLVASDTLGVRTWIVAAGPGYWRARRGAGAGIPQSAYPARRPVDMQVALVFFHLYT